MLGNLSRDPPRKSISIIDTQLPDPWAVPMPTMSTQQVPNYWQPPQETHPLISPAGNPAAKRLPAAPNPVQVLLQDELKLKVARGGKLKAQLENALTLLCWIGTLTSQKASLVEANA